ncbi:hypothetical protein EON64_21410 [archaeon]|nr:MAG: hypothetical protein EON64_21410 [archaeon]
MCPAVNLQYNLPPSRRHNHRLSPPTCPHLCLVANHQNSQQVSRVHILRHCRHHNLHLSPLGNLPPSLRHNLHQTLHNSLLLNHQPSLQDNPLNNQLPCLLASLLGNLLVSQ